MQKRLKQLLDQITTLKPIPRNYLVFHGLASAYEQAHTWETFTQADEKEYLEGWGKILTVFYKIRGR